MATRADASIELTDPMKETNMPTATDEQAIARLEENPAPEKAEQLEQTPAFDKDPAERPAWEGDVTIMATCGPVNGRPSSTTGGVRGRVRFELHTEDAANLFESIGQRAFDLTFAKAHLGDGYTVANLNGRPDADGAGRAFIDFEAPETSARNLGALFSRGLIGTKGKLVLGNSQTSMDEILTKKADAPD